MPTEQQLATIETTTVDHHDDQLVHLVCHRAPNRSYCGLNLTDDQLLTPEQAAAWPDCAVCHDLRDPLFGCPTCHRGGQH